MLSKIMLTIAKSRLIPWIKRRIYARHGEPYRIRGHTLRYTPGSRPVRLRYKNSSNAVVRNDALQVELLSTSLKPGDTAIDVGAHGGQYCILMAAMVGDNGNVIAFEPDPYALELLLKNLATFQRLRINRFLRQRKTPTFLNLGSGPRGLADPHWINVDGFRDRNVHFLIDFNRRLPFPDRSFAGVFVSMCSSISP